MSSNESISDALSTGHLATATTIVTTEHFTLQGARAATVAEANGRASVFLGAVSGGLVALGLFATAASTGTAFLAFGLILLLALTLVGLVTYDRVLQGGLEDFGYGSRIARLRGYYFAQAPELTAYLLSVPAEQRLVAQGLRGGRLQGFVTAAGMVAMVTSMLAGSAVGLLAAIIADHSVASALIAGLVVAGAATTIFMRHQKRAWRAVSIASQSAIESEEP